MFVYSQQNDWPCDRNGLYKSLAPENNNGQHSVLRKQVMVYVYTYMYVNWNFWSKGIHLSN